MLSVGALPSSPNVMQTISWLCRIVQNSLSPAAELENPLGRGGRSNLKRHYGTLFNLNMTSDVNDQ